MRMKPIIRFRIGLFIGKRIEPPIALPIGQRIGHPIGKGIERSIG